MLQLINNAIMEDPQSLMATALNAMTLNAMTSAQANLKSQALQDGYLSGNSGATGGSYVIANTHWPYNAQTINWGSYPVYVCSDKTAKAIEILKALQADKIIEVKSVPKFIELVEKITGIL